MCDHLSKTPKPTQFKSYSLNLSCKRPPPLIGTDCLMILLLSGGGGGGGAENERRRREFVGGSGGIPPQKMLKSRGSEIVFTAFSARYFLK